MTSSSAADRVGRLDRARQEIAAAPLPPTPLIASPGSGPGGLPEAGELPADGLVQSAQLDHPDFPGRDLSRVRCAFAGGATVPPALAGRIESAVGAPLSIQYGQTEASPCITQTRPGDSPADRAETLGRPHPQVEVQITDSATGETLPAGAVGEICTRGYHVMKGYFGDPTATGEAVDTAGWLHTGDLGSMDERGYCRIEGRLKR